MKKRKVIGTGFHKTGTTTLGKALTILGYKVAGARPALAADLLDGHLDSVFKMAEHFDGFQDNPWALLYREFDHRFPDSRFVLTIRDEKEWIRSVVNHLGKVDTDMRKWIYGVGHPMGNEDLYIKKYRQHNQEVLAYFGNRKNDLLIVDWSKGNGWEQLCHFLNEPVPNRPFPHANKGRYK